MNKRFKQFIDKKLENWQHYSEIPLSKIISPITILLGPNGTGKSMSMRLMQEELKHMDALTISYATSKNDIVQKGAPAFGDWDISKIAMAFSSEGERMGASFFSWIEDTLLPSVLKEKDKDLYVFIDEADSGLSIDKINEAFNDLIFIVNEERKRGRNIYFIISANSYELAEIFNKVPLYTSYIWVPTKEYISLGSYQAFKKRYMEYYERMNYDEEGNRRN